MPMPANLAPSDWNHLVPEHRLLAPTRVLVLCDGSRLNAQDGCRGGLEMVRAFSIFVDSAPARSPARPPIAYDPVGGRARERAGSAMYENALDCEPTQ